MNTITQDLYFHQSERKKLIGMLQEKGIKSQKVLEAIEKAPRHFFVPPMFQHKAYQDIPLSIDAGQTISQPYTVAFQSEQLEIQFRDKVLEIGTGSGYQFYILHLLGAKVYSIERQRKLQLKAKKTLLNMIGSEPNVFYGDGTKGLPAFAPFDKIIVTAGGNQIPKTLVNQLKIGGKMIIPIGDENHQEMHLIKKTSAEEIEIKKLGQFRFVPLIGKEGWKAPF